MKIGGTTLPPAFAAAAHACRDHLLLAAGLSALVNILYLAPTLYMMQVYDRVVSTGGLVTLLWLTLVAGFALGTLALLDAIRSRIMMKSGLRLDRLLAEQILDRALRAGGARQALRDFDSLRQALSGTPAIALFDMPWTPVYILVAFLLHPWLGLFVALSAATVLAITIASERAVRAQARAAVRTMTGSYLAQERIAEQAEVIGALGMRHAVVQRQLEERRQSLALSVGQQGISIRFASLAKFLRLFLQSLALGVGAWLAIEHLISAGAIIATSVLLSRALQPIEQLVASWKPLIEARQAAENLVGLFDATEDLRGTPFALPAPKGAVAVSQLTLHRPGRSENPVLAGVGFSVDAGEMIGVIGPSGAGKSTLLRVLAGAVRPDHGTIRVDGSDMRDWDQDRLAVHFGYLPQDCALLPGSVAENISRFGHARGMGKADIEAGVLKAARIAGVHEMIARLPGGYDMRIGWNGEGLSAGQRQRVALARALFGDPAILLLDEPNAALDAEGEAALISALVTMREAGSTIVVAAHRPAILAPASRLLLLNAGRVAMYAGADEVRARLGMPLEQRAVEVRAENEYAAA